MISTGLNRGGVSHGSAVAIRESRAFVSRSRLFSALVVIGFANGVSEKFAKSVSDYGWFDSVVGMAGVSVIVWGGLLCVLLLLEREDSLPIRRVDVVVAAGVAGLFLLPIPDLSWLALDCLAVLVLMSTGEHGRRAAAILFALTIPMFWARLAMAAVGNVILEVDAILVGWIVGTPREGNLVPFSDGSGALWIAPACSSFANVSLAVLAAVTFVNWRSRNWSASAVQWGAVACLAVVAINTLRIGLIGLYPAGYELFHGPIGSTVAAWITTGAILGLCHYGIRRSAAA